MTAELLNRGAFSVFHELSTRWNDNDQYGHVNNAVYYEYFDSAVNAWLTKRCGDVTHLGALGVVAETNCRYLRSAAFPQPLDVGIALLRLGRSSVSYQLAVFPHHGEWPHVIGRFVHVYVDPLTRRPTAVPPKVAAAVATLSVIDPGPEANAVSASAVHSLKEN
ncbi:thioesterase family protein [Nocardioides sp. CER19]|uniref:acyl-CoA thioesterase n=1 Tax=Nocardioides sp. CER19 TaxID=3038538 RepID=UPI00244B31DF|nr:thioesterase family protein [Nocardioides sp. CER19]MDH2416114.1 thioesterase family protein [Nocardioides sp. CER19]